MPGLVVHLGAIAICSHGGQSAPTVTVPRVLVSGQPVATIASPYVVAGCPFPPASGGPCVSAQWIAGATRVLAMGQPVALQGMPAVCAPTGAPLWAAVVQPRVMAM